MLLKGNENPYLGGKPVQRYLPEPAFSSWNPFANLVETDRANATKEIGRHYAETFQRNLRRLQELCRSCNFFQLLAHFAYYDHLLLDAEHDNGRYRAVSQSAIELLQGLILQIPEQELSRVLGFHLSRKS